MFSLEEFKKLRSNKPSPKNDGLSFGEPTQRDDNRTEEDFYPLPTLTNANGQQIHISQSLIKAYVKSACDMRFYQEAVLRSIETTSSQTMDMGWRFEYLLTGALNRQNEIPGEILTATGRVSKALNERVESNAISAKEVLIKHGFDMTNHQAGVRLTTDSGLRGDLDLVTTKKEVLGYEPDGIPIFTSKSETVIVDIKYSGLLGNEWEMLGWNWTNEDRYNYIFKNSNHIIQALHYQMMFAEINGFVPRFFFAVFDNRSGHEGEHRIFEMVTGEQARIAHLERITTTVKGVQSMIDEGVNYQPSYDVCKTCKHICKHRVHLPEIVTGVMDK